MKKSFLAGLSDAEFLRRHWQKKPLLARNALDGEVPAIARDRLFAFAGRELEQSIARDRTGMTAKSVPGQEWFFLPMPPQEFGAAQTGKKTLFHVKRFWLHRLVRSS